ncbi:MAG TPA: CxxC-x17-CxxC domain-containing protein [Spirochaetia bacterium]|nr:CxxC-x17-CxxC domain-containing protein [Spirochaetia bacterium]
MTYFNRGSGGDSRSQFYSSREGFGSRGNDHGTDRRELFDATCAKCGGIAKVPFKPNGRKEVFCSKCFETVNGGESRDSGRFESRGDSRSFGNRDGRDTRSFADRPMFSAICDECGDNCQIPFEPRNGKPVLCSDCFAKKDGGGFAPRTNPFSKSAKSTPNNLDLSELNAKLDKIIKLLTPVEPKNITEKILKTIEINSGKEVTPVKKKAKIAKKKVSAEK